ncbi:VOC family protein [Streptomyces sp. NPDC051214]|uniref:VOC family protein n=1 Tax=Streptomyces sp. NPDC051214 TaxID=3155282 RepID=UPI0034122D9D
MLPPSTSACVPDQDEALEFYVGKLGLEVSTDVVGQIRSEGPDRARRSQPRSASSHAGQAGLPSISTPFSDAASQMPGRSGWLAWQ